MMSAWLRLLGVDLMRLELGSAPISNSIYFDHFLLQITINFLKYARYSCKINSDFR
jgi:hypothetical protein